MSNSIYIDANVQGSRKLNETNNRWSYPLEETMTFPPGTQISLNSSLINLQGTVGSSITFDEDINETMTFGYYIQDTFQEAPCPPCMTDKVSDYPCGGSWSGVRTFQPTYYRDALARSNYDIASGLATEPATNMNSLAFDWIGSGTSETPFPVINICEATEEGGQKTLIAQPHISRVRIFIKAGTYSVSDIADLITDQINGASNIIDNQSNIELYKNGAFAVSWTGMNANNTTTIPAGVLKPPANSTSPANTMPYEVDTLTFYGELGSADRSTYTKFHEQFLSPETGQQFTNPQFGEVQQISHEKVGDETIITPAIQPLFPLLGVSLEHYNEVLESFKYQEGDEIVNNKNQFGHCHFTDFSVSNAPTSSGVGRRTVVGFNGVALTEADKTTLIGANQTFYDKVVLGSPNFKLGYNPITSSFELGGLHMERRQPNYDRIGNAMPSPGTPSTYVRRCGDQSLFGTEGVQYSPTAGQSNSRGGNFVAPTGAQRSELIASINNNMTRFGGIYILNWAEKIADKFGDKTQTEATRKQFLSFSDYFTSVTKAETAFKQTIWGRLGFSYKQLAEAGAFERHNCLVKRNKNTMPGFTTNVKLDPTITQSISTLYNPFTVPGADEGDPAVIAGGTLASSNGLDLNTVLYPATAKGVEAVGLKAYESSMYYRSTMVPVQTTAEPVIAENLPVLRNKGYLLITSDTLQNNDMMKKKKTGTILDMVPISSLNSEDFIQNRNMLVHTLTNPLTTNEININVLLPDLTDIALQENSTVLLQIQIPTPPLTLNPQNIQLGEEMAKQEAKKEAKKSSEQKSK